MQTFLIVVGIIIAVIAVGIVVGLGMLRKLAARGTFFVLQKGIAALKETAKAEHYSVNIRQRIDELETEFNALPQPSFFNAGDLIVKHAEMIKKLGAITTDLSREDSEHQQSQIIEGEAVDVTPREPLAMLPAPSTTDEDPIVAAFKAEWVKPEGFVLDAWIEIRGEDRFLMYQLNPDMEVSDFGKVPAEFQGLPTVITWFPRDQK